MNLTSLTLDRRLSRCLAALFLLLGIGWAPALRAGEIEGVSFRERVASGDEALELVSVGLLRYRVFFRGYVAALYLAPGADRSRPLDDVAKRLELEYFWSIPGEKFGEAADRLLARSYGTEELLPLRERLAGLHRAFRDVEPGDRYSLTYRPGRGTELALNDEVIHRVPGADFAAVYFGIWLGDDPIDVPLRDQLLGRI